MRRRATFALNHDFTPCYRSDHGSSLSRFLAINIPRSPGASKSSYLVPHVPWWLDRLFSRYPAFIFPIFVETSLPSFRGNQGPNQSMKHETHCPSFHGNQGPNQSMKHETHCPCLSWLIDWPDLKLSMYQSFLLNCAAYKAWEACRQFPCYCLVLMLHRPHWAQVSIGI
jgi:hypothetical protein